MGLSLKGMANKDRAAKEVEMQHRHFAKIAEIIRNLDCENKREIADQFATGLASTNRNFDRTRFICACI